MQELKDVDKEILEVLASESDDQQIYKMLMNANIRDTEVKELLMQLNSVSSKRYRFILTSMSKLARGAQDLGDEGGYMEPEKKSKINISTTGMFIVGGVGLVIFCFIMLFIFTYINPDVTKTAIGHTRDLVSIIKDSSSHSKQLSEQSTQQGGTENVQ